MKEPDEVYKVLVLAALLAIPSTLVAPVPSILVSCAAGSRSSSNLVSIQSHLTSDVFKPVPRKSAKKVPKSKKKLKKLKVKKSVLKKSKKMEKKPVS